MYFPTIIICIKNNDRNCTPNFASSHFIFLCYMHLHNFLEFLVHYGQENKILTNSSSLQDNATLIACLKRISLHGVPSIQYQHL